MKNSKIKFTHFQKYNQKKGITCKCGGDCFCDGEARYELPLGFGSHSGRTGFYVDKVQLKGFFGPCIKCHKYTLAYTSKKLVSKEIPLHA